MPGFRPLFERVMDKVDRRSPHECWPWTGATTPEGRPVIHVHWDGERRQIEHAARAMYRISYGIDIASKHVHHICENSRCMNPQHLEALEPGEHMKKHTVTHCHKGHEYTPENTRMDKNRPGVKHCRACARERAARERAANPDKTRAYQREYQRRRRAARLSAGRDNLTDN